MKHLPSRNKCLQLGAKIQPLDALAQYNIGITVLQDVRFGGSDIIRDKRRKSDIYYSGREKQDLYDVALTEILEL